MRPPPRRFQAVCALPGASKTPAATTLPFRKRDRTPALQDAGAFSKVHGRNTRQKNVEALHETQEKMDPLPALLRQSGSHRRVGRGEEEVRTQRAQRLNARSVFRRILSPQEKRGERAPAEKPRGCKARATLGSPRKILSIPTGLCHPVARWVQPRRG